MTASMTPTLPPDLATRAALADTPADARLKHLFRAALKSGRIHPLYMPILKYRLAKAASCTSCTP